MYSFIVLGLVPGTNLQITFQTWLYVLGLLVVGYGLAYLRRPAVVAVRAPLHASQLHNRH